MNDESHKMSLVSTTQDNGFEKSGSNAMLGEGLYITDTLEKALNYAKSKDCEDVIFKLRVDLGRCYTVKKHDERMKSWHREYDSVWSPPGINVERGENCIKDPKGMTDSGSSRVEIADVMLGNTTKAKAAG